MTYYFRVYHGDRISVCCYLASLHTIEQGDHVVDNCEITDELREELEEGCIGCGPFKDQNLMVWTEEDGEENIIAVINIEEAIDNDRIHDCRTHLGYGTKGKHIIGVQAEKGGFHGDAELEIEDFNDGKITFGLVNLAENWFIINSVQYDGQEIEMDVQQRYFDKDEISEFYDLKTTKLNIFANKLTHALLINLFIELNSLIGKVAIGPWITGQQDDLQTMIHSRAQHLLHDLYPFRIRVSKGIIKHKG